MRDVCLAVAATVIVAGSGLAGPATPPAGGNGLITAAGPPPAVAVHEPVASGRDAGAAAVAATRSGRAGERSAVAAREPAGATEPAPGAAPAVRIADLKQLEAALAAHRGTGVVINFWAIWCEPCVAEMPELVEVAREYRGRGVVLTVSYDLMVPDVTRDDVVKSMRGFVAARGIDLPVLIYDGPDYDAINARFGLPGPVPVTIAIDRDGKVVERHAGKAGKDIFAELIEKAIGR